MRKKIIKNPHYKCIGPSITPRKIQNLQKDLQENRSLRDSIGLFDILAGETRARILYLLIRETRLCVGDIADILQTSVSAVSHQLQVLKKARLVRSRRQKKVVFYNLAFGIPKAVELLAEKRR